MIDVSMTFVHSGQIVAARIRCQRHVGLINSPSLKMSRVEPDVGVDSGDLVLFRQAQVFHSTPPFSADEGGFWTALFS